MFSGEMKRTFTMLGVFALPVVLVKGFAFMSGGPAPASAEASLTPAVAPAEKNAAGYGAPMTESERHAAQYAAQLRSMQFGATPMFYASTEAVTEIVEETADDVPPECLVQAIMGAGAGRTTALIDGNAYRVGDELAETGWFIREIDAATRTIVIEQGETGRTAQRTVETSG